MAGDSSGRTRSVLGIGNGIPRLRRDPRSSKIYAPDTRTQIFDLAEIPVYKLRRADSFGQKLLPYRRQPLPYRDYGRLPVIRVLARGLRGPGRLQGLSPFRRELFNLRADLVRFGLDGATAGSGELGPALLSFSFKHVQAPLVIREHSVPALVVRAVREHVLAAMPLTPVPGFGEQAFVECEGDFAGSATWHAGISQSNRRARNPVAGPQGSPNTALTERQPKRMSLPGESILPRQQTRRRF